jgi:peptidoglycan/xylan/chitin deacetylase (PgdA/CDA1 family)
MTIPGIRRLRRAARWVVNRLTPQALVLLYHRVAEVPTDPHRLCVTPRHFAEHLEVLRRHYRPTALRQLAGTADRVRPAPLTVVLTFDDGYADNLYQARPLLERWHTPATVFVVSGYVGQEREFWWDDLDRLLLQPGRLPAALRLGPESSYHWELGEAAQYGEAAYQRQRSWSALDRDHPGPRQSLFCVLHRQLRPLPELQRRQVLDQLVAWAGVEWQGRPSHRTLRSEEVWKLADGGLVEVGAHTVTHPVLHALPADEQRTEIRQSKASLEEILGRPVTSFSYPYGTRADYSAATVALVREAGFRCACSNFPGAVRPAADPFQLPRLVVRDWDGDQFAKQLWEWTCGWFAG